MVVRSRSRPRSSRRRVVAGIKSRQPYPCRNNRIAVDYASRGGWMVYESGGSVMIGQIAVNGHNQIANERPLVLGSSPRIVFDGQRYWISYLDERGDVVVGFLDENGALDGTAIEGTRPMAAAYDLAVIGGTPWAYAIDANGVGATRLCAVSR